MSSTKKIHYGVDIVLTIIIALLLLGSCQAPNVSKVNEVKLERYEEKPSSNPQDWQEQAEKANQAIGGFADLANKVSPEDLCRPQYQNEIDQMGIRLINNGNEGKMLTYTGDANLFPNYHKYKNYFSQNVELGEQIRTLSGGIKDGKYKESVQVLLQIINKIEALEVL